MGADRRTEVVRFDVFELDLRTGELRKGGTHIRLQPQPFKVLALLARRPGELVTREEIQQHVWGGETFVDFDQGLNFAMKRIRAALGDDPETPRYIETLPRRGYRFIAPLSEPRRESIAQPDALRERVKLAVLPLENLSGDPAEEYFVDGMTEELITQLGGMCPERLGVIARTTAMKYKDVRKGVDEIGRELDVDYVVEGSLRRASDRVRVSLQLIQVKDQTHRWAQNFERERRDTLLLQDEVARSVAGQIRIKLVPETRLRYPEGEPLKAGAYDAYLRGRYYWSQLTSEALRKGFECFEQAIAIDSRCTPAYVGLADCYMKFAQFDQSAPRQAFPRARQLALKALEMDDLLAEAHASIGIIRTWYDWDWVGAEEEFRRAIGLNPTYTFGYGWYAILLLATGRREDALREIEEGLTLDPAGLITNLMLAMHYYFAREYGRAVEQFRKTVELHPCCPVTHWGLGYALLSQGKPWEAREAFQKAVELSGSKSALVGVGVSYWLSGEAEKALAILNDLREKSKREYVPPSSLAAFHLCMGEMDQAFALLEDAFEQRDMWLVHLGSIAVFDPLRSDRRFLGLLHRMNLPAYQD